MTVSKDTAVYVVRELMKLSDSLGISAADTEKSINASKGSAKAWLEAYRDDRYRMSDEVKSLCAAIMYNAK